MNTNFNLDALLSVADAYLSNRVVSHPMTDSERECSKALNAVAQVRRALVAASEASASPRSSTKMNAMIGGVELLGAQPAAHGALPEVPSIRDSCDYEDFHEDLLRLSEPGLSRKQAKIIRSSIINTIDSRVRAFPAIPSIARINLSEAFCIAKGDPLAWDDPNLINERAAFLAELDAAPVPAPAPLAQSDDTQRMEWLEQWLVSVAADNVPWTSFGFDTSKTAREQIDAEIAPQVPETPVKVGENNQGEQQ